MTPVRAVTDTVRRMSNEELIARCRARRTLRDTPALARALRKEAGLTLVEVAATLGVSHATVSRWETGQRVPRGDDAQRYLDLLRKAAA